MLQCGNQQWHKPNADVMTRQSKMRQPDVKWQHGNEQGCLKN